MSLYNMVNGFNPACLIIMPMLGRKQEDYPRFRDCFVANKQEIVILTRVGGNNRNQGYGEEELYKDPHFLRTFDDEFDSTYGYYVFSVPEKWKKDFDAIMEDRFSDVSEEYVKYLEEFWPRISTSGIFRKVFRGEEPDSDVKPAPIDLPDNNVGDMISRQAAINALFDWEMTYDWDDHCREKDPKPEYIVSPSDVIKRLPPAEPKRGKWIDTGGNEEWYAREYRCSECDDTMLGEANFCPNCGAKMWVTE